MTWWLQGIYPLPYWTGIIVFHAVYAGFELKRFQNFNKYGEVGTTGQFSATAIVLALSHIV